MSLTFIALFQDLVSINNTLSGFFLLSINVLVFSRDLLRITVTLSGFFAMFSQLCRTFQYLVSIINIPFFFLSMFSLSFSAFDDALPWHRNPLQRLAKALPSSAVE